MSEEIIAKDNLDDFFGKINEAVDMVSAQLIEVAPEAADALLTLVQFKGIFELAVGFLCLAMVCAGVYFLRRGVVLCQEYKTFDKGMFLAVPSAMVIFFSGIFAIGALSQFYNWLAAFYPVGALSLKALEAVGITL